MSRIVFFPYNMGSASPIAMQEKLLTDGFSCVRARRDGNFRPRANDLIINWGNGGQPISWRFPDAGLNSPAQVNVAGNKLLSFEKFKQFDIDTPEWTHSRDTARAWLADGHTIIERHVLRGHSGEGIKVIRPDDPMSNDVPLFVKYKKKKNEYRVHVFNGTVLFTQEKRRERDRERSADESLIRSHANGWVFCRENIESDGRRDALAIKAIEALGLDFGAVDIIYNQKEDKYYVLEVNTAPGLEGQSVIDYTDAFVKYQQSL
jgi:glutathione synthase/RimK-type ligase-like ATP-grasp enzyme